MYANWIRILKPKFKFEFLLTSLTVWYIHVDHIRHGFLGIPFTAYECKGICLFYWALCPELITFYRQLACKLLLSHSQQWTAITYLPLCQSCCYISATEHHQLVKVVLLGDRVKIEQSQIQHANCYATTQPRLKSLVSSLSVCFQSGTALQCLAATLHWGLFT